MTRPKTSLLQRSASSVDRTQQPILVTICKVCSTRTRMARLAAILVALLISRGDLFNDAAADESPPKPSANSAAPNVLLICIDDLRPELNCFGADYIHSPNIDALADRGVRFSRHYVQAPTCGASRYSLLTGRYGPSGNGALFGRAAKLKKQDSSVPPSMPAWMKQHGYTTVSVGKVSHHPGGRGGNDWDDDSNLEMPNSWDRHLMPCGAWQHPRGAMHGLARGEIRGNASKMDVFQSEPGPAEIYPDGLILQQAKSELKQLSQTGEQPFFMAVGFIRPHLPFGAPAEDMKHYENSELPQIAHPNRPEGTTTWHRSGEFMKYNRWGRDPNSDAEFAQDCRLHYAACVTYADRMVGQLLEELDAIGQKENTVVILWGDHGWHLGEHAIWGKHALFEESLHSPLIIVSPKAQSEVQKVTTIVETLDIFPTICDLCSLPIPKTAHGDSLAMLLQGKAKPSGSEVAVSYAKAKTIRTDRYRLVLHAKGDVELYDHVEDAGETQNIASQHPEVVKRLTGLLNDRLSDRD